MLAAAEVVGRHPQRAGQPLHHRLLPAPDSPGMGCFRPRSGNFLLIRTHFHALSCKGDRLVRFPTRGGRVRAGCQRVLSKQNQCQPEGTLAAHGFRQSGSGSAVGQEAEQTATGKRPIPERDAARAASAILEPARFGAAGGMVFHAVFESIARLHAGQLLDGSAAG